MKKFVISLIILCLSFNSFGQENDSPIVVKNEIGIVISDLLNGSFQFKYERLVGKQFL